MTAWVHQHFRDARTAFSTITSIAGTAFSCVSVLAVTLALLR